MHQKGSLEQPTNLGINTPSRKAASRTFINTVIFSLYGLLPIVMTWNKDEQNMGTRPMAGNSFIEITPQGVSRARAGMKAKMDMRRSWRQGSVGGGWWAMVVGLEVGGGEKGLLVMPKMSMKFDVGEWSGNHVHVKEEMNDL
jgi:hypothetical protein